MQRSLVVSFSDFGSDPRIDRQIDFLRARYRVMAAGFGPPSYEDIEYIELEHVSTLPARCGGKGLETARTGDDYRLAASVRSTMCLSPDSSRSQFSSSRA